MKTGRLTMFKIAQKPDPNAPMEIEFEIQPDAEVIYVDTLEHIIVWLIENKIHYWTERGPHGMFIGLIDEDATGFKLRFM